MSFFYNLNDKLNAIRATPEVTHKQLNERDMSRAAKGYEKYGKQGMEALAKAGREGKALDPVRAKYDKYDNSEKVSEDVEDTPSGIFSTINKYKEVLDPQQQQEFQQVLDKIGHPADDGQAAFRKNSERVFDELKRFLIANQVRFDPSDFNIVNYQRKQQGFEEGDHSQDAMKLNPDFAKVGKKPSMMDRVAQGAKKVADFIAPGDEELLDRLQKSSGARQPGTQRAPIPKDAVYDPFHYDDRFDAAHAASKQQVKEKMSPGKAKSFAALAPPRDKITFADKIAGAKKEVDEMLGDVAAEAMKKALGGGRGRDQEMEEASTGNAFDWKNRKEPEVQKSASYIHKGTYGTEYDGDKEDARAIATKKKAAADAGQAKRGRGRPKNNASADTGEVMKPDWSAFEKNVKVKPHTGKITKHKMVGEDDLDPEDQGEYDQEGDMAKDSIKTVVRHAQALEKILGDNDNLPEWVQSKLAKIESMMTAVDDYMQNQADDMDDEQEPIAEKAVSKKQQRFMGMVHATQKGEKAPSKEVAKVAKSMGKKDAEDFASTKQKGLPEKAAKKTKEKDVEESTTSGSVATSTAAPKASKGSGGFTFGKGIYDSMNREVEDMIAESMSVNMSMNNDGNGPTRSLTVTATDEDATRLAQLLKSAGLGGDAGSQGSCSVCGGTDCGCDAVDESYGDDVVSQNSPDYPTNTEKAQNNFEYSGGLNKPKSTGQTTVPVIAGQSGRTDSYADTEQDALHRMMEMSGIREAKAKPDFLDKDGDKQEPMKKAVDDKKIKVEEADTEFSESIRRMREIAGLDKKAVDEEKTQEGNKFAHNVLKAKEAGKKEADLDGDGDMEKVRESIFTLTNQWKAYKG